MKYERIWRLVKKIPRGKVATYGQIARLAGIEGQARFVGYALHGLPWNSGVPWHRVINAQGRVSLSGPSSKRQQALLERENIIFQCSSQNRLEKISVEKVKLSLNCTIRW